MGAVIDNTLAAQVPQFNLANTLQQGAQAQAAQDAVQAEQLKAKQNAVGAEMRGVAPFVNSPEFPQKWAEAADNLLKSGAIDPNTHQQIVNSPSPLMLKSIIAKTEDPALSFQKDEAQRAQGNADRSYSLQKTNADRTYGLAARAADRADQTPLEAMREKAAAAEAAGLEPGSPEYQAFSLGQAAPQSPAGFAKQPDGSLAPMPGGPQDPAYLASKTRAEAMGKADVPQVMGAGSSIVIPSKVGTDGPLYTNRAPVTTLDDQTVKDMADQYLAGDRTVLQNLGRGAQGAENIVKLRTEISNRAREAGVDPKGIVNNFNEQAGALAGQRAVGTRAANISLAANEANNMIPIALAASDKLPRTQYMPWNQMIQHYQKGTSSPELASFVAATNSLVNSYVRAVSPSGVPTDSMRQHAYDMLNAAQGPEAYKSVISTMKLEMDAALAAPSQVKKELRGDSKPSAPDRFKQLVGTGLNKDQAYAKMHEEGY